MPKPPPPPFKAPTIGSFFSLLSDDSIFQVLGITKEAVIIIWVSGRIENDTKQNISFAHWVQWHERGLICKAEFTALGYARVFVGKHEKNKRE